MSNLRVIIVTPEAPDPFGNAAARWYYALAKGLVQKGHRVRLLSAYSPAAGEKSLGRAREVFSALNVPLQLYPYPVSPWLTRKWTTFRRPFSHFISDELRRDIDRCLRDGYDILNLEQMWAGYLGLGIERALLSVHHLELLDLAGVFTPSLKFVASKHLMMRAERHLIARSPNIRVTTSRLRGEMAKLNHTGRVFTVPVAIDPDLYEFVTSDGNPKTVGLIATFSWSPGFNAAVRLLTRVWPKVKEAVPDASLLIVGWNARSALARHLGGRDVTVIENVPDIEGFFRRLSVLIYPLTQGSGMKIKLLEAMAYGTPVVTTNEGAEGLLARDGVHAFIADEDDAIVEKTVQVLHDEDLRRQMTRDARALVEEQYSPGPVVAQMERIYDLMLTGNR